MRAFVHNAIDENRGSSFLQKLKQGKGKLMIKNNGKGFLTSHIGFRTQACSVQYAQTSELRKKVIALFYCNIFVTCVFILQQLEGEKVAEPKSF